MTQEGWYELLRQYTEASAFPDDEEKIWELLWLYVPDYTRHGRMNSIVSVPSYNNKTHMSDFSLPAYWKQTDSCAGFNVHETCPWRDEEMQLLTYTPQWCFDELKGCQELVAYARIQKSLTKQSEATWNFITTIFTCVVLTTLFIVFNGDTDTIVIKPIKKVVDIIQKLAENPLKKPEHPASDEDASGYQMKTRMLELTIFKIGTLL
jgi:hypothetical protein